MTPEEARALQGLLAGGPMTPDQAAVALCCPLCCLGPVRALGAAKPWRFKCRGNCSFAWKSTDVGLLQQAIRRRVALALAPVSAAEGVMADGPA